MKKTIYILLIQLFICTNFCYGISLSSVSYQKVEIIAIVVTLFLNTIMLVFVGLQIILNQKTLKETQKSFKLTLQERCLENLPESNFIIYISTKLERWKNDLIQLKKFMKKSNKKMHSELISLIDKKKLDSPKGLVEKFYYDKVPEWLSIIYVTGARYYYNSMAPIADIYRYNECGRIYKIDKELIERFEESIYYLSELIDLINDIVPESYLNAPDSLSDKDFI